MTSDWISSTWDPSATEKVRLFSLLSDKQDNTPDNESAVGMAALDPDSIHYMHYQGQKSKINNNSAFNDYDGPYKRLQ
ncbi:hypothetical protein CLCR_11035 [Cladophialophora carrionii]|uniref:Uncharacterized protein n=1 Tax=Cladophialophora carrionii TaxID=86049 RepID=A0A1C1CZ86_9EURO|nr:hypothetical protein CLCR_11035 [Cladophialophora carrionii]